MITILLQKILEALTQLLLNLKTKLNTIKDNLDNLIVVATASGPIASFNTNLVRPLLSCIVNIPKSVSGTDTVIVTQTGANFWDEQWELGSISTTNGSLVVSTTTIRTKNKIKIVAGSKYSLVKSSGQQIFILFYDKNDTPIQYVQASGDSLVAYNIAANISQNSTNGTFTVPSGTDYILFRYDGTTTYSSGVSINYPSNDTEYHAHVDATTKTVSLPSTVYGGDVDIISGNITKTYDTDDLGDLAWSYESDEGYFYSDSITDIKSGSENCLCESGYTYDAALSVDKTFTVSGIQIRFRDDTYSAAPDFKTAVTGIDFIYELAEADTDSITPEVITALNGVNNIFSDSGNVTIEYLKII